MEARFCRYCGARLAPVSDAATNPFFDASPSNQEEVRTGLETTRIGPGEIDQLFRPTPDEEATVISAKAAQDQRGAQTRDPFDTAELEAPEPPVFAAAEARPVVVLPETSAHPSQVAPAGRQRLLLWIAGFAVCLIAAVVAAWLLALRTLQHTPTTAEQQPTPSTDARALARSRVAEAETLLAAGRTDDALARLREAIALDPTNAEAYRRLGNALLLTGARREAINAFLAAVANAPNDRAAWRALADAQMDEGMYKEAAESYRRLFALSVDPQGSEDGVRLRWAEALLRSGQTAEARALLQSLAVSPVAAVAGEARRRLAEFLPLPTPPPVAGASSLPPGPTPSPTAGSPIQTSPPTPPATTATPSPSPPASNGSAPRERFERGVALWSQNRAAALEEFRAASRAGISDAYYYLGLNIAEGRDPRQLSRAELISALYYFQMARAGGGRTAAQARRYEERLGQEYDRRRGQAPR